MNNIKDYEAMAKLDLSDGERGRVSGRAGELIESFKKLENIDVSGVEPLVSVLDIQNVLREDVCVKTISREELLSNAPEQYDGYFQAPKTLE
ncbi:MAG: Asp-tRNA(Asn)/Glu-tRNA(Gln) amidotransferase subunit GatC [Oscillospiraceae bacterium]|nr:Asp-tRNA(Asn)/Glu-tRNA(Gln) amidotransferase subunit GatC [Oscillospiraceae bacterium]